MAIDVVISAGNLDKRDVPTRLRLPTLLSTPARRLVLLFILALAVRIGAIAYWDKLDLTSDRSEYLELAYNLRAHGTFGFGEHHAWGQEGRWPSGPGQPSLARAPGYPAMIAALWWGDKTPLTAVKVSQAVLGAGTAVLVYSLGGWIAGIGMALSPLSIYFTAEIMSETLSAFLTTLGVWLWAKNRYWWAGIILGLATLTKPLILPLLVGLGLYGIFAKRKGLLSLAVGALVIIVPWIGRDYLVSGRFVPVNAYGWSSNIFFSTIDVPYGSGNPWRLYAADRDSLRIVGSGASDVDAEQQMLSVGLKRIRAKPFAWLWSRVKNFPRAFVDSGTYLYGLFPQNFIKPALFCGNVAFLVLALSGLRLKDEYIWLVLAYCFVAQFPSAGGNRYLLPVVPLMMVSVGNAIETLRKSDFPVVPKALRRI